MGQQTAVDIVRPHYLTTSWYDEIFKFFKPMNLKLTEVQLRKRILTHNSFPYRLDIDKDLHNILDDA